MQDVKQLKARWDVAALAEADRAFVRMDAVAAYQGKPPPFPFLSPFGEHEGRADFRCFPFGTHPVNRLFERVDLSGATNERRGQLAQCCWVDCRFDRIAMETNLGQSFLRCSFVRAKLGYATLHGDFDRCDFSHADLSRSGGGGLRFADCNFDSATLVGANWQRARFERCMFGKARIGNASFAHAKFVGGRPDDTQLAMALVPGVVFEEAVA